MRRVDPGDPETEYPEIDQKKPSPTTFILRLTGLHGRLLNKKSSPGERLYGI